MTDSIDIDPSLIMHSYDELLGNPPAVACIYVLSSLAQYFNFLRKAEFFVSFYIFFFWQSVVNFQQNFFIFLRVQLKTFCVKKKWWHFSYDYELRPKIIKLGRKYRNFSRMNKFNGNLLYLNEIKKAEQKLLRKIMKFCIR